MSGFPDTPRGKCECCWHIIKDGERGDAPAVYRWTTQIGNVLDLCADCCASWRANAVEDPDLAPESIVQIRPVA